MAIHTKALTLPEMQRIENGTITGAAVSSDRLMLTRKDGTVYDGGGARGPAGFPGGSVIELGPNIDLNTLTTSGYYTQSSNVEAANGTNYPVPFAGLLQVETDAIESMRFQTYIIYNGGIYASMSFVRTWFAGVWSEWEGYGQGPWQTLNFTGRTDWIPYGSTWCVPQWRVSGNMIKLRGLIKVYASGFNMDYTAGVSNASVDGLYPVPAPKARLIFYQAAGRQSISGTPSAGTAHTHTTGIIGARVDVNPASGADFITVTATAGNYIPEGQYASLSGIMWDWKS